MSASKTSRGSLAFVAVVALCVSGFVPQAAAVGHDVDRLCNRAEINASDRLRRQIENYRFLYALSLSIRDERGVLLDPVGTSRARNNLLEVCSMTRTRPYG